MSSSQQPPRLTVPPDPLLGATLAGKYKILKKLGEGGMGSVYMAQQMPIDRMVAVKVLLGKLAQDEVAVKRFEQEARAVSKMQHPNTVTIYDYGKTEDDRLYIVMEFLKGRTLSDALRAAGGQGMESKRSIHIAKQVCASLSDAHGAGIIHRDLKPDNIFLTEVGGSKDWVKVLDFGVAKLADNEAGGTLTQTGMIFGTPKYMSPEQAEGRPIDYRADIYAIGVVLYEMLTGRPPFLAETPVALLLKHISEAPAPFKKIRPETTVPPELEAVVMKTLEKNPDKRHLNVEELAGALDACLRFMITGPVSMPAEPATQGAVVQRPPPTEVNAPQSRDFSPGDLRPPGAVPSGISLGAPDIRRMPTEPAPPNATAGTRPGSAVGTAGTELRAMPEAATFGSGTTPGAMTKPIPGPGIETLGGLGVHGDASQPIHAPLAQPKRWPLYAGIGAVLIAAGVIGMSQVGGETEVTSRPLEVQQVEDPSPKTAAVPTPPPEPEPEPPKPPPPEVVPVKAAVRPVREPKPPKPDPGPKRIAIRFTSMPRGAVVEEIGGGQIGVTPFTREYVHGADMVSVAFKLDGFELKKEIFSLSSDRTVHVDLKKLVAEAAPKPPPKEKVKSPDPKPPGDSTAIDERVSDLK